MRTSFIVACLITTALAAPPALAQTSSSSSRTPTSTSAGQTSLTKQDFVTQAAIGGMFEIQSSQIALQKSQDRDIQQFAHRMIDDHTKADDQLKSLAKGAPVPSALDDEHTQMLDRLRQANGSDFVDQYKQMQVTAHQQAVSLFQGYAQNGDDAQLKRFAQQTLPTLQDHLRMAQRIDVASAGNNGAGSSQGAAQQAGNAGYITSEQPNVWRASKVVGVGVFNEQGQKIGTINELLFNKDGQVEAAVIGVGGFLGLGERNVAVPFRELQWSMTPPGANDRADNGNPGGLGSTAGTGLATSPTAPGRPATETPSATRTADNGAAPGYPDHAVIPNASKDQLQQAPQFQYGGAPR